MITNYQLAYDDKSAVMIEQAIAVLGGTEAAREIVTRIYALGRTDGHIEYGAAALKKLDAKLEASLAA